MNVEVLGGATSHRRLDHLSSYPPVVLEYVQRLSKIVGGREILPTLAPDIPSLHPVRYVSAFYPLQEGAGGEGRRHECRMV